MQSDKHMWISHCINLSGSMAIATRMIVYVTTRECNKPVPDRNIYYNICHPTALCVILYYSDL